MKLLSIRQKHCFYVKTDKGNRIVNLDKCYFDTVSTMISKNPLPKNSLTSKEGNQSLSRLVRV